MELATFCACMERIAPRELALDFDNVGLLVEPDHAEIKKVLLALDCTAVTAQEAIALGSNIVVGDNYQYGAVKIEKPADFELPSGKEYEWYSRQIQSKLPPSGGGSGEDDVSGLVAPDFHAVVLAPLKQVFLHFAFVL